MTNWDPEAQTVLSNEEVIYSEEHSRLFHVRYRIEGTDEYITIATTRPETILGDTAIAVNPDDERYAHLQGKKAIVPIVNRVVPIIFDRYVEMDFGTGALKVTPAHDINDYEIGKQHNLETIDILTPDGKIADIAGHYVGMDRFEARKAIVKDIDALGQIAKIEDYRNKVGRSERSNAIVEPRLTLQWFLNMKEFANTALSSVEQGNIRFFPDSFINMLRTWLAEDNIKDWCISRQLWWGQQIPAWYIGEHVFVAPTAEDALSQAKEKLGNHSLQLTDLLQDEDVVDTWFSSWLWPISVFDGFERQDELKYYYPTQVLVTGWDIIFFWVARMIMAGYEWSGDLIGTELSAAKGNFPFKDVYFTGMVRDNKRQKMSKSLGNSPDSLELMAKYGADGVRFGLLSSASAGNDIIFDAPFDNETKQIINESKLCEQGLNFCNKIWNALRLITGWQVSNDIKDINQKEINTIAVKWFENKIAQKLEKYEENYKDYRLSEITVDLYTFIWDDFCGWYLEMIKPPFGESIDADTLEKTVQIFERLMTMLHPIMPFVTEEVWHQLRDRVPGDNCIVSKKPNLKPFDLHFIRQIDAVKEIITKVREVRNSKGVKMADQLPFFANPSPQNTDWLANEGIKNMLKKMANLSSIEITENEPEKCISIVSGADKYYVLLDIEIDIEAERERIQKELEYQRGFVASIEKKLSNERFVSGAPAAVVDKERQKMNDGLSRIGFLEDSLRNLK